MKKFFVMMVCAGLVLVGSVASVKAQPVSVSGSVSSELLNLVWNSDGLSAQFRDTWTGDLAGHGHTHIFSSSPPNPANGQVTDVESRMWLNTPDGNLKFEGTGTSTGPFLNVVLTLIHGTGKYKNATGQLNSSGMIGPNGVESTYSGTITLVD